jgi:hypothetical protein
MAIALLFAAGCEPPPKPKWTPAWLLEDAGYPNGYLAGEQPADPARQPTPPSRRVAAAPPVASPIVQSPRAIDRSWIEPRTLPTEGPVLAPDGGDFQSSLLPNVEPDASAELQSPRQPTWQPWKPEPDSGLPPTSDPALKTPIRDTIQF